MIDVDLLEATANLRARSRETCGFTSEMWREESVRLSHVFISGEPFSLCGRLLLHERLVSPIDRSDPDIEVCPECYRRFMGQQDFPR